MFLSYNNEIGNNINPSHKRLFTDDYLLYREMSSDKDLQIQDETKHPTASLSPPPKLNETDTKSMPSNVMETDSDDELPEHKHCDICNLELKSPDNTLSTVCEKLMEKTSLDLKNVNHCLTPFIRFNYHNLYNLPL